MKKHKTPVTVLMAGAAAVGIIWTILTGGILHWIPIGLGIAIGLACMKSVHQGKNNT